MQFLKETVANTSDLTPMTESDRSSSDKEPTIMLAGVPPPPAAAAAAAAATPAGEGALTVAAATAFTPPPPPLLLLLAADGVLTTPPAAAAATDDEEAPVEQSTEVEASATFAPVGEALLELMVTVVDAPFTAQEAAKLYKKWPFNNSAFLASKKWLLP